MQFSTKRQSLTCTSNQRSSTHPCCNHAIRIIILKIPIIISNHSFDLQATFVKGNIPKKYLPRLKVQYLLFENLFLSLKNIQPFLYTHETHRNSPQKCIEKHTNMQRYLKDFFSQIINYLSLFPKTKIKQLNECITDISDKWLN